jgi:hypothetical protein
MALVDIGGVHWAPPQQYVSTSAPAFTTVALTAAAHKASNVFRVPIGMTIDQIAFSVGSVTTAANLDVRVETLTTSGAVTPSGVLWAAGATATGLTPTANTVIVGTLSTPLAVTTTDDISIVVQPTGAAAISLTLNRLDVTNWGGGGDFPYGSADTGSGYTNAGSLLCIGVHDSVTGKWVLLGPSILPIQTLATNVFSTSTGATTGTRRGTRFKLKFPATLGWTAWKISPNGTNGDFALELYSDAGASLRTVAGGNALVASMDANRRRVTNGVGEWVIPHESGYDLVADTYYRLVLVPLTTNSVTLYEMVFNTAAHLDALTYGQNMHACRFISSAWSDAAAERPMVRLGLTRLDDGSAGGTTVVNGGAGVMNRLAA